MWLNLLWQRWYGRIRPFPKHVARRRLARRQLHRAPRLESLEDRTLLSAPAPTLLGGTGTVSVPATSQGGQVSGTYFLGGTFNTGNQSIGGISSTPVGQFGAQLNLNLSGKVGLDLGYSASTGGQVNATYNGVSLQQNYMEPTQFNQQVEFTPQNTNVSYGSGSFSTTGPSLSASAALDANVGGSVGGTFAFFQSYSGSTNFNASINQPLFSIGIGSTGASNGNNLGLTDLSFLGQNFADQLNQYIQDISLSADVNPLGPEVPLFISGSLNGSSNPLGLHEGLSIGVGEGEGDQAVGGSIQLGSMDQYIPDLALNTDTLQNGGVLTATGTGNIADLNIQMGPVIGQLLGEAGLGFLSLAGQDTLSIGPASVTLTPVSFQMGPNLTLVQTSTITPTSQLTYNFSSPVVVTLDGQVQNGGNPESSITFTPGKDTLGVQFSGKPITVTPTWNFTENYTNELDLDVDLQGTLTAGELSAAFGPVSTPTLGPLYQQNFDFANFKIATIYNNTSAIATKTAVLPSFVIGSTFNPSLTVTQNTDSDSPGSLRGAVLSADVINSATPQVIHLGPGTYNLTIASNGSGAGSSGGLYVSAQNLIIEGAGLGQTIINATGLGDRVFDVASGANLTLEGVTVTGGSGVADGGGILNSGTLTVNSSAVTNNSCGNGGGGGIINFGTLTVSDSTIEGNTTYHNGFGNLSLGGGIENEGGATIINSTIDNNLALNEGGGIYNVGVVSLTNSTIYGNETASNGGGIAIEGFQMTLVNCTISSNSANGSGGGIYAPVNTNNFLYNTIVAGNFQGATPNDITGVINSPGPYDPSSYNLIGDGNGMSGLTNGINGNLVGQQFALIDPRLAPLDYYGGPTKTQALLSDSPAIEAGTSNVFGGLPLTDQRGYARTVNDKVDIGAVQYQYDLGLSGYLAAGSAPGTVQYVYIVTNNGPDPVAGATLKVPLPQGTTFQSVTASTGWIESDPGIGNNGTVTFTDTGSLNSGESGVLSITAQLQNTSVGSTLTNTATVSSSNSDNDPQNNSVNLTVTNEQEGQAFNKVKLLHFTDPNPNVTANDFNASVVWGVNDINTTNDGTGTVSVVADPNGGFDVLGSHDYTEEGSDGIAVTVTGLDDTSFSSGIAETLLLLGAPETTVFAPQQLFVVADAPLMAGTLTPPPNATINQAISNAVLFHFSDADPNDSASEYTAAVTWGDGSANSSNDGSGTVFVVANPNGGFDVIGSHTYRQIVNSGTFSVQVSDAGGSSTSASNSKFQVLAPDQPLIAGALNVPSVTTEGQSISNQVLFHFSDADPDAQTLDYLATVAWGDGTSNHSNDGSGSVSILSNSSGGFDVVGSHTFSEGSGHYFSVRITDLGDSRSAQPDLGGHITGAVSSTPLTITDPSVIVTTGQPFSAMQSTLSSVQTVATFTDPGGPEPNATDPNQAKAPYIATIQWGDGTVTVTSMTAQANYTNASVDSQGKITGQITSATNVGGIVLGSDSQTFSVNLAHKYINYGNYTITLLLNHEGVLSAPVTTTAIVAGNDTLTATGGSPISSTFGTSITNATVATFTDTNTTNPASEFTAVITWGDGQSSAGMISGSSGTFTVTGSHTYADAGAFPIGVTISNFGGSANVTTSTSATVNPATPSLTATDPSGTYNGHPFAAKATAVGVDGQTPVSGHFTFAYYAGTSASGTPLSDVPVNAGTYTVVATFTSNDPNYSSGGTVQTTFTISAAAPTLSVTDASGTYYGSSFTATAMALGVDGKTPVAGSFSILYYTGTSASGTPLSGPPVNAGTYTVVASFKSDDPNYANGTAQTTFTIAQAMTAFSKLTVQQIILGASTTVVSGQLTSNTIVPIGQKVSITLNGVTQASTVRSDGTFSISFTTAALGAGTYTISYSYAGDTNFTGASGSGSLTVAYGSQLLFNNSKPVHSGAVLPIKLALTDASGTDISSPNIAVKATGLVDAHGNAVPLNSAGHANPNNVFRYDSSLGGYIFNLDTKGLAAGTYTLYYTVGNDPTKHSLTFMVD